jgi:hypothetical protein
MNSESPSLRGPTRSRGSMQGHGGIVPSHLLYHGEYGWINEHPIYTTVASRNTDPTSSQALSAAHIEAWPNK